MDDIVKGDIGKVGKYDLDFKNGKLVLSVEIGSDELIGLIKAKIPGSLDDVILELLKGVLAKL